MWARSVSRERGSGVPHRNWHGHRQRHGYRYGHRRGGAVWERQSYGVWTGHPVERLREVNDHFQIHATSADGDYRIAVTVRSKTDEAGRPIPRRVHPFVNALYFFVDDDYAHPITHTLAGLPSGFTALPADDFADEPHGLALDYIRLNLFDRDQMRLLPARRRGADNDLIDILDRLVLRALREEGSAVYAFGAQWRDLRRDEIFGITPNVGIHDIHMNQASIGSFARDNAPWHDGALFFSSPREGRWAALFLKFQSQAWHSDDETGAPIERPERGVPVHPAVAAHEAPETLTGTVIAQGVSVPDGTVRIIAALVNAVGGPEGKDVTLLNTLPEEIDLAGWLIADRHGRGQALHGTIPAGGTLRIPIAPPVHLSRNGGAITLLDAAGLKVDGVAYTRAQAACAGVTIVF